jgi:ribosomal protein L35AE/L33A
MVYGRSCRALRTYDVSVEFVVSAQRQAAELEVEEAVFICDNSEGCLLTQAAVRTHGVGGAASLSGEARLAKQA